MELSGLHHVTMITADARGTVDFAARVLGLRFVKKTVNFDQPDAYHLYFGDERGAAGSILTWFEFPQAAPGRAGAGTIHTIELSVGSAAAVGFWEARLAGAGIAAERDGDALRFADRDGLRFAIAPAEFGDPPLRAAHPEIAPEHAIIGIEGARAHAAPGGGDALLRETLGFTSLGGGGYRLAGELRSFRWAYDPAPPAPARLGAGSVHHIAWASRDDEHAGWQRTVAQAGAAVTDVRDRDYFRSIYFREPHGVLFEIATLGPGFAVDEDPEHLGEELRVPAMHAHLRERLERTLAPLENPRALGR